MAKKSNNTGRISSKTLLLLLLVGLLALVGWVFYDNNKPKPAPPAFQTKTGAPPLPLELNSPTDALPTQ